MSNIESIGFIGIGNMGYAMLKGAAKEIEISKLTYTDMNKERLEWVKCQTGVDYVEDNNACVSKSKYIILAVKPKFYSQVLDEINQFITSEKILISIAPGIEISWIKSKLDNNAKVVRAMPNTPALVGEGQTAICYSQDEYSSKEKEMINKFFTSFGKVTVIEEKLMDSVVPISGSSPAYVFMFIEALADGGVKFGLSRQQAYEMAAQTVLGSAKMVLETMEHPGVLKDQVCSPGGTTIEAVAELEKNGFRSAILEAMDKCYKKCK